MASANQIITKLRLQLHPEGGKYRQTLVGPLIKGRASGTAILFLLQARESRHWHRVDADEIWRFNADVPLLLRMAKAVSEPATAQTLGPDILGKHAAQATVPMDWWQAATTAGDWSLVSCTVSPGFQFAGFELAAPGFDIPG